MSAPWWPAWLLRPAESVEGVEEKVELGPQRRVDWHATPPCHHCGREFEYTDWTPYQWFTCDHPLVRACPECVAMRRAVGECPECGCNCEYS